MATESVALIEESEPIDGIFPIGIDDIEPDELQPRLNADEELSASIATNGVIQAITVRPHPEMPGRYVIVDGERRWRGAKAAKLATIPAVVRYDQEDDAERLITQLVANTGKPLTPLEEAEAYRRILADPDRKLTQVKLAEMLGKPRTLIGDRVRMLDLDPVWIKALRNGDIQTSHTPVLHAYSAVPSKYQEITAQAMFADYRAARYLKAGEPIPGDDFSQLAQEYFGKHLRALTGSIADWPKGAGKYEGPIITRNMYGQQTKFAADPDIWRPLIRSAAAQRTRANKAHRSGGAGDKEQRPWLQLPEGSQIKKVKHDGYSHLSAPSGHVMLVSERGAWALDPYYGERPFDPDTLLQHVEPEKLYTVVPNKGSPIVTTTDTAAHGRAVSAFVSKLEEKQQAMLQEAGSAIRKKVDKNDGDNRWSVDGHGIVFLLRTIADFDSPALHAIACAIEVEGLPKVPDAWSTSYHDRNRADPFRKWANTLPLEAARKLGAAWAAAVELNLTKLDDQLHAARQKMIEHLAKRPVNWSKVGKAEGAPPRAKDIDVSAIKAAKERGEQLADMPGADDDGWDRLSEDTAPLPFAEGVAK